MSHKETQRRIEVLRERLVNQLLWILQTRDRAVANHRWLVLSQRWSQVMMRRFPEVGGAW